MSNYFLKELIDEIALWHKNCTIRHKFWQHERCQSIWYFDMSLQFLIRRRYQQNIICKKNSTDIFVQNMAYGGSSLKCSFVNHLLILINFLIEIVKGASTNIGICNYFQCNPHPTLGKNGLVDSDKIFSWNHWYFLDG